MGEVLAKTVRMLLWSGSTASYEGAVSSRQSDRAICKIATQRTHHDHHVENVLARGEAPIAICLPWISSEDLPVSLTGRIFQTYVCPSAQFGLDLLTNS